MSVRSGEEARAALDGGCDLLDVKEPSRGALGRADRDVIEEVIRVRDAVAPETPVSAALGELTEWLDGPPGDFLPLPAGVRYAKLGLAGVAGSQSWIRPWSEVRQAVDEQAANPVEWVLVAYADCSVARSPSVEDVFAAADDLSWSALLIDTWSKGRRLRDWLSTDELETCAARCRERGVLSAFAGRLTRDDMAWMASLTPDIVGVRGAACQGGERGGAIEAERVRDLRVALRSAQTGCHPSDSSDPSCSNF